jgi:hypothetical protein
MPRGVLICLNPQMISEYDDRHENVTVRFGYLFAGKSGKTALVKRILENKSTAYCFFRDGLRNMQARLFGSKDLDVAYYFDKYSKTNAIRSSARREDFLKHLRALEDDIRKLNATPVCVYCPTAGGFALNKLKADGKLDGRDLDTSFYPELVKAHCDEDGIQFINLEPVLQKLFDDGKKLNIELDGHFNAPTSKVIGEYLYESLRTGGSNGKETDRKLMGITKIPAELKQ